MRRLAYLSFVLCLALSSVLSGCAAPAAPAPAAPPPATAAPAVAEAPAATEAPAAPTAAPQPTAAPTEAPKPTDAPKAAAPSGEQITLRMAVFIIPAWMDYYTKKAEEFTKLNPNIKVETQLVGAQEYFVDMTTQLAAGVGPDLIFVCNTVNFPEYAAAKYLVPLDDYLKADNVDLSDYVPEALQGATYEGKLYALPDSYHNGDSILYYNKTMFDKAGVAYPTDDWTYDDLAAAAKKLTTGDQFGYYPLEFTRNISENASTMRSFGCEWLDKSMTKSQANSPECLQAIKWDYANLDSMPLFDATVGHDKLFTSGNVAMVINGPWVLQGYIESLKALGMEVGTAKIPKGPKGRISAGAAYGAHGVTVMSKHPAEAAKFVEFVTNEQSVKDFAALNLSQPARKSSLAGWVDKFPGEAPAAAAVEYSTPPMNTPANLRKSEMSTLIFETMQGVWLKQKTPEAALAELHTALQKLLDEPKP
jgi:multiple sugar transport system substrate-binding protein